MKYLITKQIIFTDSGKLVIREAIETSDIEDFRRGIKRCMRCEKVLLTYEEKES